MKKRLLPLSISAILLGASGVAPAADEDVAAWRLFVADHDKPVVNVFNAVDGKKLDSFALKGPAALHRSESGATVYAVQGGANAVSVISSGIAFHDHGDHADIDIAAAKLLSTSQAGKKPGHFVERQGKVAQWFDGERYAVVSTEAAALKGDNDGKRVLTGPAHHGVAVPYDNYAVVSVPNPQDATKRPVGARVTTLDSVTTAQTVNCPGLHGSAGSGDTYALSCETGLLLITQKGDVPEIRHLPYSAGLPKGSISTLIGGKGMQYFIGNYGPDRIVIIDPTEENSFRLVQLPTRRVHFAVDPVRPKYAYVFTEDGKLNQVDVLKGSIVKSVRVTAPYSMDGHWNDARPRIAVADGKIFITDPLKSKIHVLSSADLNESAAISVEGEPFNIVAVGGSGKVHGHDHGHDHGHEHGHDDGHDHGHSHGAPMTEIEEKASRGVFSDSNVKDRSLSDWNGVWQSVYPVLVSGEMDPVFASKAKKDDSKTAAEIKEYYTKGYATDVTEIKIDDGKMSFFKDGKWSTCDYNYDGYKILNYASGKKGVRYLFECKDVKSAAPRFVQFSDHTIGPRKSAHFHLFMGDSSQNEILKELEMWPTYYPYQMMPDQIVDDLLHH